MRSPACCCRGWSSPSCDACCAAWSATAPEPTAADIARLQDLIEDEGVTTVFSETLVSPETAETLARDAGVEADVLDPIEGLADTTAEEDYLSLMRANLEALRAANGC